MHSGTNASYGVEVKSGDILRRVRSWNVPTSNVTSTIAGTDRNEPIVSTANEREAITNTLNRYAGAYNQKDAAALWKVYPAADSKKRQQVENSFRNARSISVTLSNIAISITVLKHRQRRCIRKTMFPGKVPNTDCATDNHVQTRKEQRDWTILSDN
jgi:hypothetical protein